MPNQLYLATLKLPILGDLAATLEKNQLTLIFTSKSILVWTQLEKFNTSHRILSHKSGKSRNNLPNNSWIQECISPNHNSQFSSNNPSTMIDKFHREDSWKMNSKWCSTNRDIKSLNPQSSSRNNNNNHHLLKGRHRSSPAWTWYLRSGPNSSSANAPHNRSTSKACRLGKPWTRDTVTRLEVEKCPWEISRWWFRITIFPSPTSTRASEPNTTRTLMLNTETHKEI